MVPEGTKTYYMVLKGPAMSTFIITLTLVLNKEFFLYALRLRMHSAKSNFKKINAGNLLCSQGCQSDKDQVYIFENCPSLNEKKETIDLDLFLKTLSNKKIMKQILHIELRRLSMLEGMATDKQCFIT